MQKMMKRWLLALSLLMLAMTAASAQGPSVTLKLDKVPVSAVLRSIESQTDYVFYFKNSEIDVDKVVSIDVRQTSISEIVEKVLPGTVVRFESKKVFLSAPAQKGTVSAPAQEPLTITGTVRSMNGEPLTGAMVFTSVNGTDYGEVTDLDGNFRMVLPSGMPQSTELTASMLGYVDKVFRLGGKNRFEIVLEDDRLMLEETVVVGYARQKKVNVTGSVTSINFDDKVMSRPLTNVSTALNGLSAGMAVTQSSGKPGSSATISIRGTGTLNDSSPLVLVDGVEWDMDNVNPADIENISVLKDASSTAIYGALGANGVILITTKTGAGRPKVSYNGYVALQQANNRLELVSDYALHMELANEYDFQRNRSATYSQSSIKAWKDAALDPQGMNDFGIRNYIAYPNTDWFDVIFKNGFSHNHHLTVSGASEKIKYSVSMGFLDNRGVMNVTSAMNSGEKKLTFQSKVDGQIGSWLNIGANIQGRRSDLGMGAVDQAFQWVNSTIPGIWPGGGSDNCYGVPGCIEESTDANNLIKAASSQGGKNILTDINLSANFTARIVKGLTLEGKATYQYYDNDKKTWSEYYGSYNFTENYLLKEAALADASITNSTAKSEKLNFDLLLRYANSFKDNHHLVAFLGFNSQHYKSSNFSATRKGMSDWGLHELSTATKITYAPGSSSEWGMISAFGRINYDYKEKYLFEANLRCDGSSRFSAKSRWGWFPSASAGWRISREPWMQGASGWLSNLKLRASYGSVGNCRTGDYAWQAVYNIKKVVANGGDTFGLVQSKIGNEDLKWETTVSANVGLDAGFFDDRLTLEFDAYDKNTKGILYTPSLYLTMGTKSGATLNLASVNNRGVELGGKWSDTAGDFFYSFGGNFSFNRSLVTKYKGALTLGWNEDHTRYLNNYAQVSQGGYGGYIVEGHALGETYMLTLYEGSGLYYAPGGGVDINGGPKDGMIRTQADMEWVNAMLDAGYSFKTVKRTAKDQLWYGDLIYADIDGDGNYGGTNDYLFTGHSSIPKVNYAFNISLAWKGFDFYALFSGAAGFWLNYQANLAPTRGRSTYQYVVNDHYFYNAADPMDPRTNITARYPRLGGYSTESSNFWEYKGDYVKLKNVQLGYSLPADVLRRIRVDKLRFYVTADNLFTLTKFPGMDPELGTSITYPILRQYAFGVQLTF